MNAVIKANNSTEVLLSDEYMLILWDHVSLRFICFLNPHSYIQ